MRRGRSLSGGEWSEHLEFGHRRLKIPTSFSAELKRRRHRAHLSPSPTAVSMVTKQTDCPSDGALEGGACGDTTDFLPA